ncbi:putative serine dehydratase domain-containing protein [Sphaerosporella brunnea]|uniref:D-serine dehydratase n=1 Tax=Sphaerosporella brunnea TaxID=1250544 RepID=A0A5J5F389_9PEZI|nr:putative serine dehydratase domain-containing protein [Sphaerosporella brunnea]
MCFWLGCHFTDSRVRVSGASQTLTHPEESDPARKNKTRQDMSSSLCFPSPTREDLAHFVGLPLGALPTPCAIVQESTVRRNCRRLVEVARDLGVGFRPHVKTHKTTEITRLQLEGLQSRNVIVSTVREAEALEPLVREGVVAGILYGLPLPPSAVPALRALRRRNPGVDVAVLLDHPAQIPAVEEGEAPWSVFVKVDNGYHRAGLPPDSSELRNLLDVVAAKESEGALKLVGFYSHAGHSYGSTTQARSLQLLLEELHAVLVAARVLGDNERELVLSVGATPTALAAASSEWREHELLKHGKWSLELHAGVYTLLDLQQLATRPAELGLADVALTIMAEVVSVYPERDEVLVALGSTALGREPPPKDSIYPGWGTVTAWKEGQQWDGCAKSGWIVSRISQEHAVLARHGEQQAVELKVGAKVRVWPQHACIAGNGHGWYFVTDGEKVTDVWVRWRGW